MAKESTDKRPSAAESLVKATVTVLDNVNVQAYFMRASMESAKQLGAHKLTYLCLLYTSPSPRDATLSRMPSSA